jgi:hypothetical protein
LPKPLTAPARLALLLPWLNGDLDEHFYEGRNPEPVDVQTDFPAIRRALAAFLGSFDGSAEAAHVVAEPNDDVSALDDEAIGDLRAQLTVLIDQGFGENPFDAEIAFPASSLRFAVRNAGRQKPAQRGSIVAGGVTALRNYRAAGAYALRVQGPVLELVPFLLGHLLTAPNMASVKRCERQGCPHFVITATAKRGRPQRFCSAACREWNRELEQQRKSRRRK